MNIKTRILLSLPGLIFPFLLSAQNNARVKISQTAYKTYAFSDPDPVPVFGSIYPYYRYDGFSNKANEKTWTVAELENDFLIIKIFPEIGGKIWSVIDKTSGKELFYGNNVVKFRDISLRGPWTSGGIEFNYGVMGHAPSCAFPVNYLTRANEDGSVSCFINDLDLLTRTSWTVEINLPKDKGWFTTRSFWHNKTSGTQPYYNWVNAGVLRTNDLSLVNRGTHSLEHDGSAYDWPFDIKRNKDLSLVAGNDFGEDKSYHVLGRRTPYFGAFWPTENFGVMQYTNRDEKPGRKIFLWASSGQGEIWKDLLSDKGEQYVEIQSGRLFNQNYPVSSLTPFKQIGFVPYATDTWNEYWFPFKQTGGVGHVCLEGVVNLKEEESIVSIFISPLQKITDTLKGFDKSGNELFSEAVSLDIAIPYSITKRKSDSAPVHRILLGQSEIWSKEDDVLQRPVKTDSLFDPSSSYGLYLKGRDLSGMRLYEQSEAAMKESLTKDPLFVPALTEMARLQYHRMNYDSAFIYAKRALSIDTYDPEANFEYGRSALKTGKIADALDGFEIAALTPSARSAAFTEISRIYLRHKKYAKAIEYAEKSMVNNRYNIEGLQLIFLLYDVSGHEQKKEAIKKQIKELDPLNYFLLFEDYFMQKNAEKLKDFSNLIKKEMPEQVYLELGIWYYTLGFPERSSGLLRVSPGNPECRYWLAFIERRSENAMYLLHEAQKSDPHFVFPFREESMEVFQWANTTKRDWKAVYFMSLIHLFRNNIGMAKELILSIDDENPAFAPFYALRSQLFEKSRIEDLNKAIALAPAEWRYVHRLAETYMQAGEHKNARNVITPFYKQHKNHYLSAIIYAKILIANNEYEQAESVLNNVEILPFEGAQIGRELYRKTKLMLAVKAIRKRKYQVAKGKIAESELWPVKLGVGKPYDELIDSAIENKLSVLLADGKVDKNVLEKYLSDIEKTISLIGLENIK
ncbi:MAG: DUF5107 domain-containing protein [Chitinophagaceae bacterium]|nr:DUF5107 domain-containing protein [Chitinophagaceae bacterium]